jgi:hypothetical protein
LRHARQPRAGAKRQRCRPETREHRKRSSWAKGEMPRDRTDRQGPIESRRALWWRLSWHGVGRRVSPWCHRRVVDLPAYAISLSEPRIPSSPGGATVLN